MRRIHSLLVLAVILIVPQNLVLAAEAPSVYLALLTSMSLEVERMS